MFSLEYYKDYSRITNWRRLHVCSIFRSSDLAGFDCFTVRVTWSFHSFFTMDPNHENIAYRGKAKEVCNLVHTKLWDSFLYFLSWQRLWKYCLDILPSILSGFLNTLTNFVKGNTVVLMMVRNDACFMRIGRQQSDLDNKYLI